MKPNILNFSFLVLLLLLFNNNTNAQMEMIYTDDFAANWYTGSNEGNTSNVQYATNPHGGSRCIQISYTEYSFFGFDHRKENWTERYYYYPNQYKYLNFYFKTSSNVAEISKVAVTLDLGESVWIKDYIQGTIASNTWYNVRIPFSAMNPENKKFFRVHFYNLSTETKPVIYLDDIYLEYVADNAVPVISDFEVTGVEQDMASLSWNADEPVLYTFRYRVQGSTGAYTTISTEEYEPRGNVKLLNLTPNTTYEYQLVCSDHQRDPSITANNTTRTGTFATKVADAAKPVISNMRVINTYPNRVVIGWDTDEPSNTIIDFGEGAYSKTNTELLYKKMHTVVLTHLKPATMYQYKISSADRFGNKTEMVGSPVYTFTTPAETAGPSKWVVVDHPMYQWNEVGPDDVPWEQITHLNLGQLWPIPSASGFTVGFQPGSYWADDWGGMKHFSDESGKFIANAHKTNRKVICLLGGEGTNPNNEWIDATSPANLAAFAANIKKILVEIGFDGLDLDWEEDVDYPSLVNLAKELRRIWPEAIISIPTTWDGSDVSGLAPASDYVDTFLPMTYYSIEQWGGWVIPSPPTPLHKITAGNKNSIDYILDLWQKAGVPSSKMLLGVGGYGSLWGDGNKDGIAPIAPYANKDNMALNANGETVALASDNIVTWSFVYDILNNYPEYNMNEGWDDVGKCSYWSTGDLNKQIQVPYPGRSYNISTSLIFYESARSTSEKVDFIEKNNMKGLLYWTLSQLIREKSSPVLDVASCLNLETFVPVTKTDQAITFGTLADRLANAAPFNLAASTTSGLAITYISSDASIASISGSTVTIHKTGSVTITASQAGNFKWNPATAVQTLKINKATQTITFNALTDKLANATPFNLTASASSGLAIAYASSDASIASISGSTVTIHKAGSVTITASQAGDDKWNPATNLQQTLKINKATQTITFNTLPAKNVNDVSFPITATASSTLAVTFASSDPLVASISGSTVTILKAGTVTITATQAGNDRWNSATAEQTLTITSVTAIGEGKENKFSVYPNPVSDMLHFKGEGSESIKVSIFNLTGTKVWSGIVKERSVDVSQFPTGVYILKISNKKENQIIRFVKQ